MEMPSPTLSLTAFLAFSCLCLAFLSLWLRRDLKIWLTLLGFSLLFGLFEENIQWQGVLITFVWAFLWFYYTKNQKFTVQIFLFLLLVIFSFGFKFHLFPGFPRTLIGSKFFLGFETPLLGIFPLALLVPLATKSRAWKEVFSKGLLLSLCGIALMALLAIARNTVHLEFKIPTFAPIRYTTHLFLIAAAEEGFYRGFVQEQLTQFFSKIPLGKWGALFVSSLIFAAAHLFWSPNLAILGFTLLAGLLYGWIYLVTKRIESAILCHFLLNFFHMTFFNYTQTT